MDPKTEPRYVISIAAKIVGIEAHSLRYYERLGLIQPHRSGGNIRLYSEADIDRLRYIKTLMHELGVNPAGLEVTLDLMRQLEETQSQLKELEAKIEQFMKTSVESNVEGGTE